MKNIFITGFMGTGKTSVGKELSMLTGYPFFDTDILIEMREKSTVRKLFEERGESQFRQLEKSILRELSSLQGIVVATGGGALLDSENLEIAKQSGLVFCLIADYPTILKRIEQSSNRPLLSQLEILYEKRIPIYQKIPYPIDSSSALPKQIAIRILEIYEEKGGQKVGSLSRRIYETDPD
jgi:shikimate kinase